MLQGTDEQAIFNAFSGKMHFKAVKSSAAVQICVWKTNRRWQERGRTSGKWNK